MKKIKEYIRDGNVSVGALILKLVLIWIIVSFLIYPTINLLYNVTVFNRGHNEDYVIRSCT